MGSIFPNLSFESGLVIASFCDGVGFLEGVTIAVPILGAAAFDPATGIGRLRFTIGVGGLGGLGMGGGGSELDTGVAGGLSYVVVA